MGRKRGWRDELSLDARINRACVLQGLSLYVQEETVICDLCKLDKNDAMYTSFACSGWHESRGELDIELGSSHT